jgi:hypothetical protein
MTPTISTKAENLNKLLGFMAEYQSGKATLCTDGAGNYWATIQAFNPVTGAAQPTYESIPLALIQQAGAAITAFLALVPNATVGTNPFTP